MTSGQEDLRGKMWEEDKKWGLSFPGIGKSGKCIKTTGGSCVMAMVQVVYFVRRMDPNLCR
jgi:hypothetical protein